MTDVGLELRMIRPAAERQLAGSFAAHFKDKAANPMTGEFASWQSYWYFEHSVCSEYRFVHGPEVHEFREIVRATATKRVLTVPAGSLMWRAQLGTGSTTVTHEDKESGVSVDIEEDAPFPPQRMKPRAARAVEGRANPKGIPYLYLSGDRYTATAEVRPWLEAPVSVGRFEIVRDLKVVDCSAGPSKAKSILYLGDEEPSPAEREAAVWSHINDGFSMPVTAADDHASYVPTQILAEVFRRAGYDGIAYRSSCGPGKNYALFRLDDADLLSCKLFAAKALEYNFSEIGNPYVVRGPRFAA